MHVAASIDHPRLPAFALYAPDTMAGAPPAGPPPGPDGPNQTSLGPNHGPHGGESASYRRCRREIGTQPALDHQASPMDDKFRPFELWGGGVRLLHQKGG
ncbi:hypothetical protein F511_45159 [Dorcoceras hygrometricum]|uniref:Uncharacterized protein n=1 Tax=Dorcoceras hygrometricum TaxID=472368 RepID=A0A2Z6ZWX7_9LAMI|nr:hypothetical protein F511_45159 [Dorcoceras hygrometricum]